MNEHRDSLFSLAMAGVSILALSTFVACGDADPEKTAPKGEKAETTQPAAAAKAPAGGAPEPTVEPLEGEPRPSLLLTQAWFYKDGEGKSKPGPARLDIWRPGPDGAWTRTRLEDADSNVFHKAIQWNDGILTIGAEGAKLKYWTFKDGKWEGKLLWETALGSKFNRLRDLEIGDVDHDGKDEFVIATHDAGVVAVINPPEGDGEAEAIEMDQKADTFVHEIEIGDVDGDGKVEFFATPTDRNTAKGSQGGMMVMYKWTGEAYERSVVDPMGHTHAKEILAADLDGDGVSELFSVLEAETEEGKVVSPVEIRQYSLNEDGSFSHTVIATIDDRQTRFLVPGDFDGDGKKELVAAAWKSGLYHITPNVAPEGEELPEGAPAWNIKRFEQSSSGFEHAAYAADLDGDGKLELYVASDDQRELRRYDYNAETKTWKKTLLGRLDESIFTWNITTATL
ncbi:MAG: VCBS repeat-containing protein [Alphaproteobacteria bacterium]|nr:VCBS repeat-containing protein [Alphaproteobacteria bacterium]